MFDRLKDFFRGRASLQVSASGEPTNRDIQIATAVLLLETAGKDDDYAPEEVNMIFTALERQFKLSTEDAQEVLEIADSSRQQKGQIDEFVQVVNQSFSPAQRQLIFALAWRVVLADGQIDKFEQRFSTQLKSRLQLTDEDVLKARKLVETGKV